MLMAMPAIHHSRLERQLSRNLRAIKPAQGCGDIGQQRRGDEIAAHQPDQPCDQRQRHQFDHQHAVQHPRRDAAGAQGAQHRQALLEGEPDRRIDDEQADKERQQSERGQVQVKTVGEAFEVGLCARVQSGASLSPATLSSGARLPVALPISRRES